jgi:hypothetical protein
MPVFTHLPPDRSAQEHDAQSRTFLSLAGCSVQVGMCILQSLSRAKHREKMSRWARFFANSVSVGVSVSVSFG